MLRAKYMRSVLPCLSICALTCSPIAADAAVWIRVPDASQLYYQTAPDNHVYLRNVSQFAVNALGCCYNYYIDLNTVEGKALFSIVLSAAARGSTIWFAVPDGYAAGAVSYGGYWVNP